MRFEILNISLEVLGLILLGSGVVVMGGVGLAALRAEAQLQRVRSLRSETFDVSFWLILDPCWSHFEVILESSGGHFGTSGASRRASWLQVPPRILPGPSQDPPGEPPGGSRS